MNWDEVIKVVGGVGAIAAPIVGLAYWAMRKWMKSLSKTTKARVEAERQRAEAEIKREEAQSQKKIAELQFQSAKNQAELHSEIVRLQQAFREVEIERNMVFEERNVLQKRLGDLESFNGHLWEREVTAPPPPFQDRTRRKTVFIAVMNLKGGVGKTTLTANVGVGLARKDYRVLLVDLDFQGSLTRLCLDFEVLKESIKRGWTTDRLLSTDVEAPPRVKEIAQRIRSVILDTGSCDVIAATEGLAEAELQAQGRWLAIHHPDARFLFRKPFHVQEVFDSYDYVFFDCPPRLTTASVNALGCCDYLLVPVILEQGSVEALPRTLNWLTRLPHVSRARLLGVVANRAEFWGGQIIASQRTVFNYLPETIKRSGFGDTGLFRAVVKNNRGKIEEAANHGRIAAAKDDGLELFAEVIDEVEKGTRM